ncbi:unnamed protein product [Prorocentrum cordatum]|uniref:Uncharacterized protein n=1 Tax=Prorocentrum cordatum TaxID=2364126 RepID=A0ABN9UX12_9DINO|nr:unnamed protein product [Polarella glacialis]
MCFLGKLLLASYQYAGSCGDEARGRRPCCSAAQRCSMRALSEAAPHLLGSGMARAQLPLLRDISVRASSAYDIDSGAHALLLRLDELRPGLPRVSAQGCLGRRSLDARSPETILGGGGSAG